MPIPELRDTSALSTAREDLSDTRENRGPVRSDNRVGSLIDRNGSFCTVAEREARNSERGGLFLQAAGVGEHHRGIGQQAQHLQVTLRGQNDNAASIDEVAQAEAFDIGSRAGV